MERRGVPGEIPAWPASGRCPLGQRMSKSRVNPLWPPFADLQTIRRLASTRGPCDEALYYLTRILIAPKVTDRYEAPLTVLSLALPDPFPA